MKRILILSGLVLMFVFSLQAQQKESKIAFDKKTHDFGQIKEEGGEVTHKFTFTNTGDKPLVINEVKASCGCTSPSWSQQPISPDKKGYVSVTFDPHRRPGNFNKSILVRTTASDETEILKVKGKVLPQEKALADRYPRQMGDLRLKSHHQAFSKIKHTGMKQDSLAIVNASDQKMSLSFSGVPEHIDLHTKPKELEPGEESYIYCKYNASEVNDWGFRMDRVRIKVNENNVSNNTLVISARITEDFSDLSDKERENAPNVEFEQTTFNFGTAKQDSKVEHVFQFKNTGKRDLKIRKIRTPCGCTTAKPDKEVIAPGESSSFKAVFQTENREGHQDESIYFISNDPDNSNLKLKIKGKVENN
ncbi:MAG: DUF1573 domain-containing protein [Bacteroidota bacterium]